MKRHAQILAGTALGLLMASAPVGALPLPESSVSQPADAVVREHAELLLAQAEESAEETEEERLKKRKEKKAAEEEPAAEQETPPTTTAEEPEAAPEEPQTAEEPEAAPEEPATAAEEPPAEEPATAEEPEAAPEAPATAEEPEAAPEASDTAEDPEATPEAPATAEEPEAAPEAPATADEPEAAPEAPATAEEPEIAPEAPATAEEPEAAPDAPATAEEPEAAPDAPATAEQPETAPEAPATAEEPDAAPEAPATADEPAAAPEVPATAEEPEAAPEAPAAAEEPDAAPEAPETASEPLPENAAPVLDSAKEAAPEGEQQAAQPDPAEAPPPPESDAAAQTGSIDPEDIEPVTAEEGRRIEAPDSEEARRELRRRLREDRRERENVEVIEEFEDNRVIIEVNNNIFIESPDYERIILENDEVYYEELPRGRIREVIIRPDGTRVITVRNRYGDIIRRSRILPDNREIILVYVEEDYYDEVLEFRDPGADLPPLVLSIPREEYILEAEVVDDPDVYYTFLDQPPVEQVERTYSIAEVKRSARIRDKVRRVDLDTINFDFGSAEIEESEIDELQGVATAMERLLEENPGETFLIEGHTDAVGTDLANLALSDRRAEAVATALTNVFGIPPENLATQGYGEQYLKIQTEEPERENRRVAIRRITPLVAPAAPVASAE